MTDTIFGAGGIRTLGNTGLNTTVLGFGTGSTNTVTDDVERALLRALELGVNWIDTAAIYGHGQAEQVVGSVLRKLSDDQRPYVFTKCNFTFGGPENRPVGIGDPAHIRAECEASLERLGVERLDLLQMHWPPPSDVAPDAYLGVFAELKQEGKIRAFGLSNYSLEQLQAAAKVMPIDCVQSPLSLIRRDLADEIVPWCASHNVGLMIYSALQSGLLAGGWTIERIAELPADDWRHRTAAFKSGLPESLALSDGLQPIADRLGTTRGALALAWVLAWPGVSGVVASATRPAQVDAWIQAADVVLDEEALVAIDDVIRRTGAGSGSARLLVAGQ